MERVQYNIVAVGLKKKRMTVPAIYMYMYVCMQKTLNAKNHLITNINMDTSTHKLYVMYMYL